LWIARRRRRRLLTGNHGARNANGDDLPSSGNFWIDPVSGTDANFQRFSVSSKIGPGR
jgi:hypothetical protein